MDEIPSHGAIRLHAQMKSEQRMPIDALLFKPDIIYKHSMASCQTGGSGDGKHGHCQAAQHFNSLVCAERRSLRELAQCLPAALLLGAQNSVQGLEQTGDTLRLNRQFYAPRVCTGVISQYLHAQQGLHCWTPCFFWPARTSCL